MPGHKYRCRELEIRIGVISGVQSADDWANAELTLTPLMK